MWIDFMKVAIARSPNEQFPTAAKKALAVDTNAPSSENAAPVVKKPVAPNDDSDDDNADDEPKPKPAPVVHPAPPADTNTDAMPDDSESDKSSGKSKPMPKGYVVSPVGGYKPYSGPLLQKGPAAAGSAPPPR